MKNISYCVQLVRMDLENYSTASYQKYLQYAVLAYRELLLKAEPKVSVHYFTPNAAGLAPLPPDFEFYTKVALMLGGRAYTLTYNNNIPIPRVNCGIEIAQVGSCKDSDFTGFFDFIPHFRAGNFVGEFYSMGGGWNDAGYFRIDWKNNQILITGAPRTEYVMEYVSTGADNGDTLIDTGAVQYIRHYIHWQLALYSNAPMNEKMMKKDLCEMEFQKYKDQIQIPTISEYVDLMYCGFSSSIKGIGT